jgi:hypothetical protein
MAARPPTDDLDEPEPVEFGIAALDAHLDEADLTFPATAEAVTAALGDPAVDYEPAGASVRLSTVLDGVDRDRFETRQQLLDATHPEFERLRQRGGGLLAWLRSLFS